jgi:hypothetical protein
MRRHEEDGMRSGMGSLVSYASIDGRLAILQSLSAHVKLLLDTPEHLWRLLEQRKYFDAAWLFLLSRVIYRALVKDDTEEEETPWQCNGIDIMVRATPSLTTSYVQTFSVSNNFLLSRGNGILYLIFGPILPTRRLNRCESTKFLQW